MIALLSPRLWIAIAIAAVLAFTHLTIYRKGRNEVKTEWLASVAEANQESRRLEIARQSRADDAARIAAAAQARILADAAGARRSADGLRGDLNAAREYAAQSRTAAQHVADLATGLLGRCTDLYLGVAEAAARADSEARELRQAWPQ